MTFVRAIVRYEEALADHAATHKITGQAAINAEGTELVCRFII